MKLFCFPYAGGSSLIYKEWQDYLGDGIKVLPYELAGRGRRIRETSYSSLKDAAERILADIGGSLYIEPYCLFGHSMGAMIVLKLLEEIRTKACPLPEHVFLSGACPPHINNRSDYHLLPDREFIDVLKFYGGTPSEFFENQELLDFFLPILRNDFKLACYKRKELLKPFNTDFTVLYGQDEVNFTYTDASEWEKYSIAKCFIHKVKGSHFFINESPKAVLDIVKSTIASMVVHESD